MKKNIIILAIFTAFFAGGFVFSQETEDLEEISLPDVSTVISGARRRLEKARFLIFQMCFRPQIPQLKILFHGFRKLPTQAH